MNGDRELSQAGFTLIELLVLLAMIVLLVTVLRPALSVSRSQAQAVVCLNNKRQLGLGWVMYTHDHNGKLAGAFDWLAGEMNYVANNPDNTNTHHLLSGKLGLYVKEPAVYKCPADQSTAVEGPNVLPRVRSTAMNQMIRPAGANRGWTHSPPWRIYANTADIVYPSPASLWVLIDENPDSVNDGAFAVVMDRQKWGACWQDGPGALHRGGCSLSFADGHAEIRKWQDPQTLTLKVTYREEFPYNIVQPYNIDVQWVQDRTTAWQ